MQYDLTLSLACFCTVVKDSLTNFVRDQKYSQFHEHTKNRIYEAQKGYLHLCPRMDFL